MKHSFALVFSLVLSLSAAAQPRPDCGEYLLPATATAREVSRELIRVHGVPSDLMGEREMTDEALAYFTQVAAQLTPKARQALLKMTEEKQLSDWKGKPRILSVNYERELGEIIARRIRLEKGIVEFVRENAGRDDYFPELGTGNRGLHGYLLHPEQVRTLTQLAGLVLSERHAAELRAKIADAAIVFVALATDDEPGLYVGAIDRRGEVQVVSRSLNLVDIVDEDAIIKLLPDAVSDDYYDGFRAIYALLKNARAISFGSDAEGVDSSWDITNFGE